jgi:hypothetical protein
MDNTKLGETNIPELTTWMMQLRSPKYTMNDVLSYMSNKRLTFSREAYMECSPQEQMVVAEGQLREMSKLLDRGIKFNTI